MFYRTFIESLNGFYGFVYENFGSAKPHAKILATPLPVGPSMWIASLLNFAHTAAPVCFPASLHIVEGFGLRLHAPSSKDVRRGVLKWEVLVHPTQATEGVIDYLQSNLASSGLAQRMQQNTPSILKYMSF